MNVPDIPCLGDSSAACGGAGDLGELCSAIVIDLCECVGARVTVGAMFAVWIFFDHYLISCAVLVVDASSVLSFIVLFDKLLLSFLDILPIGNKGDVQ